MCFEILVSCASLKCFNPEKSVVSRSQQTNKNNIYIFLNKQKMSESTILITPAGYAKMVLHACKHPTQSLSGLLVGKLVKQTQLFISDVIPLTHTQVASVPHPIVEAGVRMVQAQACAEGCSVVGCYFANERFDDADFGELNRRMAKEVAKICSNMEGGAGASSEASDSKKEGGIVSASRHIVFLLDNVSFCSEGGPCQQLAAKIFSATNGSKLSATIQFSTWNRDTGAPEAGQSFEEAKGRISTLALGKQQALWDFEEHLENCSARDFYNRWVQ